MAGVTPYLQSKVTDPKRRRKKCQPQDCGDRWRSTIEIPFIFHSEPRIMIEMMTLAIPTDPPTFDLPRFLSIFCPPLCFCDCLLRCDNRFIKKSKAKTKDLRNALCKSIVKTPKANRRPRQPIFNAHWGALRREIVTIVWPLSPLQWPTVKNSTYNSNGKESISDQVPLGTRRIIKPTDPLHWKKTSKNLK